MEPWTQISEREKLRIKADPTRFRVVWKAFYDSGQLTACAQMAESSICARKAHARVSIAQVADRSGLSVVQIAQLLHAHGGVTHRKFSTNCPNDDPKKTTLAGHLSDLESQALNVMIETSGSRAREARRPWVLTLAFVHEVGMSDYHRDSRTGGRIKNPKRHVSW